MSNSQIPDDSEIESSGADNGVSDGKISSRSLNNLVNEVRVCERWSNRTRESEGVLLNVEIPSAPLGFNRKPCHRNT